MMVAGSVVLSLDGEATNGDNREPWEQIHIVDYGKFFSAKVSACPPTLADDSIRLVAPSQTRSMGVLLVAELTKPAQPLIKAAARTAFAGLTVAMMQKLVIKAGMKHEGPRPHREQELAEMLVRWQFPEIGQDEMNSFMMHRQLKAPSRHETVLSPENAALVEGMVCEDDLAEFKQTVGRRCASKKSSDRAESGKATSDRAPQPEGGAGSACSSVAGQCSSGVKRIPELDHTVSDARSYCPPPPPPGSWIGIHTGKSWQVKYPGKPTAPRSHTVTWGARQDCTKHDALLLCLRWVWCVHTEVTGEQCPWQL